MEQTHSLTDGHPDYLTESASETFLCRGVGKGWRWYVEGLLVYYKIKHYFVVDPGWVLVSADVAWGQY